MKDKIYFKSSTIKETQRGGFNNLNSRERDLNSRLEKLLVTPSTFSFETKLGDLKGPTITLQKLTELNINTLEDWADKVRTLFNLNNTDLPEAKNILKLLLTRELYTIVADKKDVESMLDTLILAAFPRKEAFKYENALKRMYIDQFNTIIEFIKSFKKNIKHLDLCLSKPDKLTKREKFNYLENALNNEMKYKLYKENVVSVEEAFEIFEKEHSFNLRFNTRPFTEYKVPFTEKSGVRKEKNLNGALTTNPHIMIRANVYL